MARALASRLKDRITIRRAALAKNASTGGQTRSWSTLAENVAAEVVNQGGREALVANSLQGVSSYRIVIRHRSDLRPADQILFRPYGADEDIELNIRSLGDDPFLGRAATQIFADTETPQGART